MPQVRQTKRDQGWSNDTGVATVLAAMAVMNTEAIAKAIDPEGRAKVMQQGADETKLALSKANEAAAHAAAAPQTSFSEGP